MPPKRRRTPRSSDSKQTETDHADHATTVAAAAADSDSTTVHPTTTTTTTHGRVSKRLKTGPAEAATMSTMAANVDEEMKEEGISNDMDQVIKEESPAPASAADAAATTSASASSAAQSIKPYGLLKLPQSIASELASDYLVKREIRDLGVTCRWMLVSLNQCVIKEPVSLEIAHHPLHRERILAGSERVRRSTANFRGVVARVPNLFIGRFRSLWFAPSPFKLVNIKQLSELNRFIDARNLSISLENVSSELEKSLKYPIEFPPRLEDLTIEGDWAFLPLNQFLIPSSLRRINCSSRNLSLTDIKWPEPCGLKTLLGLPSRQDFKNLVLPPRLLTLTFPLLIREPIKDLILPHTITNLVITEWMSDTRQYRDLPFPKSLKRLVFSCELTRNDFNLNEWTHLPISCVNLELTLNCLQHFCVPQSPVHITIPRFVQQLRIWRKQQAIYQTQPAPIHLLNASGLTSLAINRANDIDWPNPSSIVSLKLVGSAEHFFLLPHQPALPSSLVSLDLSEVGFWSPGPIERDSIFSNFVRSSVFHLPRLCRIKIPQADLWMVTQRDWEWCQPLWDYLKEMIQEWSRNLPNCTLEGLVWTNPRVKSRAQLPRPPPTRTFQRYKNEVLVHEFTPTESEAKAMKELDDQQFDAPVNPIN